MIDIAGLFIVFGLMLALSLAFGVVVAIVTWLVLRPLRIASTLLLITGLAIAPGCVVWLYVSAALLPQESLFGDIDQPLPHGYRLNALGKMVDYATVKEPPNSPPNFALDGYVEKLQLQGDTIAGQYSHPFGQTEAIADSRYFVLNTVTGVHEDFASADELQAHLQKPLRLVQIAEFVTTDASFLRWRTVDRFIALGPMVLAWVSYLVAVIALRMRSQRARRAAQR